MRVLAMLFKMVTKPFSEELVVMSVLKEDKRIYLIATQTLACGKRGVGKVSESMAVSKFAKMITERVMARHKAEFNLINWIIFREMAAVVGIPIISIDTKKEELAGNFKREGKVFCKGWSRSFDHDFGTFFKKQIVPHGIYDVTANTGYMTIGTSHDTKAMVTMDNLDSHAEVEKVVATSERQNVPGKETSKVLPWVHVAIPTAKALLKDMYHGIKEEFLQSSLDKFGYRTVNRFIVAIAYRPAFFEHMPYNP